MTTQSTHPADLSKTSAEIDTMREPSDARAALVKLMAIILRELVEPGEVEKLAEKSVNAAASGTPVAVLRDFIAAADAVRPPQAVQGGEAIGYMNAGQLYELQQGRAPYGYVYPAEGPGAHTPLYTHPAPAPSAVQAGFALVPVEPTIEMLTAAGIEDDAAFAGGSTHGASPEHLWAAMLSVASPPPSTERGCDEALRSKVKLVLEGWTLPADARKVLEAALYAAPNQKGCE